MGKKEQAGYHYMYTSRCGFIGHFPNSRQNKGLSGNTLWLLGTLYNIEASPV